MIGRSVRRGMPGRFRVSESETRRCSRARVCGTQHKTVHHGHRRSIYFGPKAQLILKRFIETRPLNSYLFSPKEAEKRRLAQRHSLRKTPLPYGNRPGTNRVPHRDRPPRGHYDTRSYARAIARACKRAGIPKWTPHQLRHSAATNLRKEFGLEVARILLGHRSPMVTETYAELDERRAIEVMSQIG